MTTDSAKPTLASYIELLRVRQWTKNVLIFAAIVFTGGFNETQAVIATVLAFFMMCLVSSSIYVFNDVLDVERDRHHPTKRKRPIASGIIKPNAAIAVGLVFLALGLGLSWYLGIGCFGFILFYLGLQIAYNLYLKHKPIADAFAVSLGFVIRAAIGAVAINVKISSWLLLCTLALALLLSWGKRRHEFILMGEGRGSSRASLTAYSQTALDALVIFAACCAGFCYGVYAIDSVTAYRHPGLIVTTIPVFYGITRYLFIIFAKGQGGEPDKVMVSDRQIICSVVIFIVLAVMAMKGMQLPFIESGGSIR